MSKQACLSRLCGLVVMILFATAGWADSVSLVTSQAALGSNDSTNWAQLGADGSSIANGATATSAAGNTVTIEFDGFGGGTSGLTSVQCPANPSCSWTGGFNPGDTLLWTNDGSGNGSGALLAYFGAAVSGAGLALQSDAPGAFTAEVQVLLTNGNVSSLVTLNSDANGDPLFLGLVDTTGANIAAIGFDIVNSGSDHDFAADTLYSVNPTTATPEPASLFLFGSALLGMGLKLRQRLAQR